VRRYGSAWSLKPHAWSAACRDCLQSNFVTVDLVTVGNGTTIAYGLGERESRRPLAISLLVIAPSVTLWLRFAAMSVRDGS
jgi:hypothetical protein